MLESLLAGQPLTLSVTPLLAWGPAAALAVIAALLILWPRRSAARQAVSGSIIVRSETTARPGRIIVGLLLAGFAMLLATVLREPQVTITAEALTCRSWPQPIAWRDVAQLRRERIGFANRPVLRLESSAELTPDRRGPLTQVADRLVGVVRGPSRIGTSGAICGLDNLTVGSVDLTEMATIAWGRARFGSFPDTADAPAIAAWCARNPGPRCTAEALVADMAACQRNAPPAQRVQACRYERLAAPPPTPPRRPQATPPRAPSAPVPTARPPAQPPAQSPAQPPAAAQPQPQPAAPPRPPATPPAAQPPAGAPPAKPPAPAVPPGKPAQ
jgi:hypothetical protein